MSPFTDRGGRSLTLRPEGTAAVMRAYIEHGGSSWPQPVKLYYIAPMFRYDRPQLGRYRQHRPFARVGRGEASHRPAREAPTICGYLDAACREHFEGVQAHFQALNIPFVLDPFIVRGLDYYTRTAGGGYSGKLGAQNAMFGGGRYEGLAAH